MATVLATAVLAALLATPAQALTIDPVFEGTVPAAVEGAIDTAINTLDGLYANPVTITVDFTYSAGAAGNLLSTTQYYNDVSYSTYVAALKADSAANPGNTVLATAVANLPKGNDANGAKDLAITDAQYNLLSLYSKQLALNPIANPAPVININSSQPFTFSGAVAAGTYDAVGGLEHELDEVLGGGGGGSTLNEIADGACTAGSTQAWFCNKVGSLDLYRYSAPNSPTLSTASNATAYLSFDGGKTSIVALNQDSGGDFGDFAPNCGTGSGSGQLIQNAFNCTGAYEPYTTASPEYTMMEAVVGFEATVPEPMALACLLPGALALTGARRRHRLTGRSENE